MGDGVFFVAGLLAAISDVCVLAVLRGVEAREALSAGHVAGLADGAVGVLGLERSHGWPVFHRVRALWFVSYAPRISKVDKFVQYTEELASKCVLSANSSEQLSSEKQLKL